MIFISRSRNGLAFALVCIASLSGAAAQDVKHAPTDIPLDSKIQKAAPNSYADNPKSIRPSGAELMSLRILRIFPDPITIDGNSALGFEATIASRSRLPNNSAELRSIAESELSNVSLHLDQGLQINGALSLATTFSDTAERATAEGTFLFKISSADLELTFPGVLFGKSFECFL